MIVQGLLQRGGFGGERASHGREKSYYQGIDSMKDVWEPPQVKIGPVVTVVVTWRKEDKYIGDLSGLSSDLEEGAKQAQRSRYSHEPFPQGIMLQ
jgi:hypothetical protein